jgi:predicted DNA-binding protein
MYSRKTPRFNFAQDCEFFFQMMDYIPRGGSRFLEVNFGLNARYACGGTFTSFFLRCFIFMSSSKEIVRRDKGMGRKATKKLYTVRMDEEFVAWVEKVARKIGRGRSELIREALVKLLLNEYRDLAVGQGATKYNNKRGSA